jgi:hypothetical protein
MYGNKGTIEGRVQVLEAGCRCTYSLRRRLRIGGGEGAFLDGGLAVGGDDEVDLSGSVLQLE